ncbi:MAG: hypothetical protein QOH47_799 [Sphingomonadales bacterium]|jgi:hypothetical protein|nr:hypothetical protein [Sphingomonadales bacterium]
MASRGIQIFGPRSTRYDSDVLAGIGAAQRMAFSGDRDEGDRRMRELIERMHQIEKRPTARASSAK